MAQISEPLLIDEVVQRLTNSYADVAPGHVADVVHSVHTRFEQCPIRDFIPLLVERRARAELSRELGLVA